MSRQNDSTSRNSSKYFFVSMALLGTFVTPWVLAQRCSGNIQIGCTNSGAACTPVTSGIGSSGRCTTPPGFPPGERECVCQGLPALDLTGTWLGNDGAVYYLRQIGSQLWWAGLSVDSPSGANDLHWGLRFSNVFQGQVSAYSISGDWADVPRGATLNSGTLALSASADQIQRQSETGGFGASQWTRIGPTYPPPNIGATIFGDSIYTTFAFVKKNQNAWRDHSLLDNLKPAKGKPVAIFGKISQAHFPDQIIWTPFPPTVIPGKPDLDPMHVNYPPNADRCYASFICLNGNDSPPDGDIDFNIEVDRTNLDAQIGFWTDGWESDHGVNGDNFRGKLENGNEWGQKNQLHIESIMYGGTTECGDEASPAFWLPGWQQAGAQGVLLNGRPIAGEMDFTGGRPDGASTINSILGRKPKFADRVRITGILALDCGHGLLHNCDEDDRGTQNQEIHPVYAVDFVQNFMIRKVGALLTGAWAADDAGTYYVRQVGNTVWWLGLSVDEGKTFANVFRGTLENGQVSGNWADIPLGQTANSGPLTVTGTQGEVSTVWTRMGDAGAFSGSSWQKLYDRGETRMVIAFESAIASGAVFPVSSGEPFELQVGSRRIETKPVNLRSAVPSNANMTAKSRPGPGADLDTRIPVDVPTVGPLRLMASFAGYRANWTIPQENLKPGEYVQTLKSPKILRLPSPLPSKVKGELTDRDSQVVTRRSPGAPIPTITIHYRIENEDTPAKNRPAPTSQK